MKSVLIARKQTALVHSLSKELNLTCIEPETIRFADSEMRVLIEDDLHMLDGAHAIIVHATSRPVNDTFVWLLLVCHALKLANVRTITAVIPYFGYGRQDKQPDGKVGATYMMARMLETAGINNIISVALHEPAIADFFTIPVHNITLESTIAQFLTDTLPKDDVTLVAPDKGAAAWVKRIAALMDVPTMTFAKERFGVNKTRMIGIEGTCTTSYAVVIDDIIDTGSTIINVGEALKSLAPACSVRALAVHPVLSEPAPDRLQASSFDTVYVGNTIAVPEEKLVDKLFVMQIGAEIAHVLREISGDVPITKVDSQARLSM